MPVSSWWRTLSRVLRIGNARYIVGHDLEQNTYMELPSLHGDPKRTRRYVKEPGQFIHDIQRGQVEVFVEFERLQSKRDAYSVGCVDAAHTPTPAHDRGM